MFLSTVWTGWRLNCYWRLNLADPYVCVNPLKIPFGMRYFGSDTGGPRGTITDLNNRLQYALLDVGKAPSAKPSSTAVPPFGFHFRIISFLGQGNHYTLGLTPSFSDSGFVSVLAACPRILPSVAVAIEMYLSMANVLQSLYRSPSSLLSNPIHSLHTLQPKAPHYNHNAVHPCHRRPLRLRLVTLSQLAATPVAYQSCYFSCCHRFGQPSSRRHPR